jgi:hypothetical protein
VSVRIIATAYNPHAINRKEMSRESILASAGLRSLTSTRLLANEGAAALVLRRRQSPEGSVRRRALRRIARQFSAATPMGGGRPAGPTAAVAMRTKWRASVCKTDVVGFRTPTRLASCSRTKSSVSVRVARAASGSATAARR